MPILKDSKGRKTVLGGTVPKGFWAIALGTWLHDEGFPSFEMEYTFAKRRWRFDFAWPRYRIALEVDGGVYTMGRHTRGAGYEADCRKMNAAAASGWAVFHVTPGMLESEWPDIVKVLRAAFEVRRAEAE